MLRGAGGGLTGARKTAAPDESRAAANGLNSGDEGGNIISLLRGNESGHGGKEKGPADSGDPDAVSTQKQSLQFNSTLFIQQL